MYLRILSILTVYFLPFCFYALTLAYRLGVSTVGTVLNSIWWRSVTANDARTLIPVLGQATSHGRNFINDMAFTQTLDLENQMCAGYRYFFFDL